MTKKKNIPVEIVRYSPSFENGLSNEQVDERKEHQLTNNSKIKSSKTYLSIFAKNIFTYFNLIWGIIAIALLCVKAYQDLLFLIVIVLNTTIAIVQEIKAKRIVEKLSMETAQTVHIIRNSERVCATPDDIVLDDILVLENGDQIPSDCIIMKGNVEVNESLLTGESVPVKKGEGANLFSGSFLISGKCYARVDKVGKDNYIQSLASKAKQFKAPKSNLFKDLNKLIKYIGIAMIPLGIATAIKEWFASYDIPKVVTQTSGAITGMIPAGMFLLITIALSVGVIKLAKKKTLVKDIYSIEMLARTDVLCLDKTGTITDGTMNVNEFVNFSKRTDEEISNIIANINSAQDSSNLTSVALIKRFSTAQDLRVDEVVEFSSSRKFSATSFSNGKTYYLGAPTFLKVKMTKGQKEILNQKMQDGYRVLAVTESSKKYDEKTGPVSDQLLAFIVIEDHIREEAKDTIDWFKKNNVAIKIISGDDPLTVSKIAQRVNVEGYDRYVSLEDVSLEDVEKLAEEYTVFGRVSPEQKYVLVKTLKKHGHVVAMTGDGVNDTLALKESDCSIAMAEGSEVARNISKLVLLDSNFASLPAVVMEGRQVINNVQKSSTLFLMKTLFTILLCVATLILNRSYPFQPMNLFLVELFVIGIPSFLLTFEPNTKLIEGNFIPQVLKKSLPRMAVMFISVLISMFALKTTTMIEAETLQVFTITFVAFLNLIWLCIPMTLLRGIIIALSGGLICGAILLFPKMFGVATISQMSVFDPLVWITLASIIAGAILLIIIYELILYFIRKSKGKIKTVKNQGASERPLPKSNDKSDTAENNE